ncbi:MAG TPA: hypothetical protein DCX06_03875 [Opitutae bacterium]|nr:hypothetical protein [Opitutae bacterium]
MPIISTVTTTALNQDSFHQVDHVIMGKAFKIHNQIGRLLDEKVYQTCLAKASLESQIECQREVEVKATLSTFAKSFFIDLLVQNGAIYEIKTTSALNNAHEAQLLNYLLLLGIQHGKLINFRPSSVEYRFVSTSLKSRDRHLFNIDTKDWHAESKKCVILKDLVSEILDDWGSHLHVDLYRQALIELISNGQPSQQVDLFINSEKVGEHETCLLSPDTGLHISSIKKGIPSYRNHLTRFLHSTNLKHLQWLNFNNHEIKLMTLHQK